MKGFHGIIFAYNASPDLRELVKARTAASLPFCGRFRLIDFALSSMRNAGIHNVGVIMQRDYQSLLDHIGSGKAWDMSRRNGGLRMLPPFGLPEYHKGQYTGTVEALNAVYSYIKDIREDYVVLMLGNLAANVDLDAAMEQHIASGTDITAICSDRAPDYLHPCYTVGEDGLVKQVFFDRVGESEGVTSLEGYVINKTTLLAMMDMCHAQNLYRFHKDAMRIFLDKGVKMDVYVHHGYAAVIRSVDTYYRASMDMLKAENRRDLFPVDRPVRSKNIEKVSTFYGEEAIARNCLIADNCIIEGTLENCIVFSGAHICRGAKLHDCIIMRGCVVGEWSELQYVIADKKVHFAPGTTLTGNPKLPVVVPKGIEI